MAGGIGFAAAFSRAGLLQNPQLTTMASNSGGTWFLSYFIYNAQFYNVVTSGDRAAMEAYFLPLFLRYRVALFPGGVIYDKLGQFTQLFLLPGEIKRLISGLINFVPALDYVLKSNSHIVWEKLIEEWFGPELPSSSILDAKRTGLQGPTALFQTSHMTRARLSDLRNYPAGQVCRTQGGVITPVRSCVFPFMYYGITFHECTPFKSLRPGKKWCATAVSNGEMDDWDYCDMRTCPLVPIRSSTALDAAGRPLGVGSGGERSRMFWPLQWVVPGQPSAAEAPRGRVSEERSEAAAAPPAEGWFYQAPGSRFYAAPARVAFPGEPAAEASLPQAPNLLRVVSMSSAALGGFVQPDFLDGLLATMSIPFPSVWQYLFDVVLARELTGTNICSHPLSHEPADYCGFPALKFADGGYVDNLALAQTVAYMQRRHGRQGVLRFIVLDQAPRILRGGVPIAPRPITSLFQGITPPASLLDDKVLGYINPVPLLFAAPAGGLAFQDLPLTGCQGCATVYLRWAKASTTTLANADYGVEPGTPVELLLFVVATAQEMVPLTSRAEDYLNMILAIGTDAGSSNVGTILREWLAATEGGR